MIAPISKDKSFYQKTTDSLLRNIAWISLISGLLLIWSSQSLITDVKISDIVEKIGLTILTSGVFAAILKSFQFIGVFKKEIESIVLDDKFIEKRNDLPELWKKVSASVYKQKFSAISNELQNIILRKYFPTDHVYYYESVIITINVEELTDEHIIKFTQHYQIKGVKAEEAKDVKLFHTLTIEKAQSPENHIQERIFYKINGDDKLTSVKEKAVKNEFEDETTTYSVSIPDHTKNFEIEAKERRQYSIKEDNTKLFKVNFITKEMDVSVSYPPNVQVLFFPLGVVEPFKVIHSDHPNRISRIHKGSLILPEQGFGLTFALK
jgi:hypothetical protein